MSLQKARDWSDLILKIASIIAILSAGCWAYYQFNIKEVSTTNIQVSVKAQYQYYNNDMRLLIVHAIVKNIGKVLVQPDKDGFIVSVKKIPPDLKQGSVDFEKIPLMYSFNILNRFPDGYELEPGVTYDEIVTFIVPKDLTYVIKATFNLDKTNEVDQSTILKVE